MSLQGSLSEIRLCNLSLEIDLSNWLKSQDKNERKKHTETHTYTQKLFIEIVEYSLK